MKASAICPGSCGELIQGVIGGRELLVSYPVNRYSRVTLVETRKNMRHTGPVKARCALERTFELMGIPVRESYNIRINIDSDIPECKGMASSTADIGAVVAAAGRLAGKEIREDFIVDVALKIEPTDSILFDDITLFDPVEGLVRRKLGRLPPMKVVVLEGRGTVDTIEFRKQDYMPVKRRYGHMIEQSSEMLIKGIKEGDCSAIGKAAIISAFANQEVLKKEGLERITEKAIAWGAVGVNVAHSGTVMGIIVDPSCGDPREIMYNIKAEGIERHMEAVYCVDIADGGAKAL